MSDKQLGWVPIEERFEWSSDGRRRQLVSVERSDGTFLYIASLRTDTGVYNEYASINLPPHLRLCILEEIESFNL